MGLSLEENKDIANSMARGDKNLTKVSVDNDFLKKRRLIQNIGSLYTKSNRQ